MKQFDNPKKTANEMINIISPLFNAGMTVKISTSVQISLKSDEDVNKYLSDVLEFLVKEYKTKNI